MTGSSDSSRSRRLEPPPEQVWAALAAFDQISRWAPDVDHSSFTTAVTSGVGAARRVQVGRMALLETVTEWDPPVCLAYSLEGLPPFARAVTNRWVLEAVGEGTQATLTTVIEPGPGPKGRIGARVLGRLLGRASDSMLDGLAGHVTAAPAKDRP